MIAAIVPLMVLVAAPQGVSVQVQPLSVVGATAEDAQVVTRACAGELSSEGYQVLDAADAKAKPMALVTGELKKKGELYLVRLILTRAADQKVLEEARLEVRVSELSRAGVDGAKQLAAQIRASWGVRAKLKL